MVQELMMYFLALLTLGVIQDDLTKVAERLRAFRGSWTSIEVRDRQDFKDHGRNYAVQIFENYVETAVGQRMLEWAFVSHNTGRPGRTTWYCDRERCADEVDTLDEPYVVTEKPSFMTEGQAAKRQSSLFSYLYLMHQPLDTFLAKAAHRGHSKRLGRDCERALITGVQWTYGPVEMVYDLDRETGFPLFIWCYASASDRAAERPTWTWEALSFDQVEEGRRFPLKSVERTFGHQSGTWAEATKRDIQVIDVKFNQDYPASMFWPDTRPKETIWDEIAKVRWRTPMPGVERSPTGHAPPALAESSSDWTAWIPWAALAGGLSALGAGIVLRCRRGRAA
jgi:hypothetical protein